MAGASTPPHAAKCTAQTAFTTLSSGGAVPVAASCRTPRSPHPPMQMYTMAQPMVHGSRTPPAGTAPVLRTCLSPSTGRAMAVPASGSRSPSPVAVSWTPALVTAPFTKTSVPSSSWIPATSVGTAVASDAGVVAATSARSSSATPVGAATARPAPPAPSVRIGAPSTAVAGGASARSSRRSGPHGQILTPTMPATMGRGSTNAQGTAGMRVGPCQTVSSAACTGPTAAIGVATVLPQRTVSPRSSARNTATVEQPDLHTAANASVLPRSPSGAPGFDSHAAPENQHVHRRWTVQPDGDNWQGEHSTIIRLSMPGSCDSAALSPASICPSWASANLVDVHGSVLQRRHDGDEILSGSERFTGWRVRSTKFMTAIISSSVIFLLRVVFVAWVDVASRPRAQQADVGVQCEPNDAQSPHPGEAKLRDRCMSSPEKAAASAASSSSPAGAMRQRAMQLADQAKRVAAEAAKSAVWRAASTPTPQNAPEVSRSSSKQGMVLSGDARSEAAYRMAEFGRRCRNALVVQRCLAAWRRHCDFFLFEASSKQGAAIPYRAVEPRQSFASEAIGLGEAHDPHAVTAHSSQEPCAETERLRAALAHSEQQLAEAVAEAGDSFMRLATARQTSEAEVECKLQLALAEQGAQQLRTKLNTTWRGAIELQRCFSSWHGFTLLEASRRQGTVYSQAESRVAPVDMTPRVVRAGEADDTTSAELTGRTEEAEESWASVERPHTSVLRTPDRVSAKLANHGRNDLRMSATRLLRREWGTSEIHFTRLCWQAWVHEAASSVAERRVGFFEQEAELARVDTSLLQAELREHCVRNARLEAAVARIEEMPCTEEQLGKARTWSKDSALSFGHHANGGFVTQPCVSAAPLATNATPASIEAWNRSRRLSEAGSESSVMRWRKLSDACPVASSCSAGNLHDSLLGYPRLVFALWAWRQLTWGRAWLHVKILDRVQILWQNAVRLRSALAGWRQTARSSGLLRWRWRARGLALLRVMVGTWRLAVFELRGLPGSGCSTPTPHVRAAAVMAVDPDMIDDRGDRGHRAQRASCPTQPFRPSQRQQQHTARTTSSASRLRSSSTGRVGAPQNSRAVLTRGAPTSPRRGANAAPMDRQDLGGRGLQSCRSSLPRRAPSNQRPASTQRNSEPQQSRVSILQLQASS